MRPFISLIENADGLLAITNQAKKLGVVIDAWEGDDYITLNWIERTTGRPGAGGRVMHLLTQYADHAGKIILLDPDGGSEGMSLYYSAYGFVDLDEDEVEDHYPDWPNIMVRFPETA